jgi:phosphatidate cytidylyltransferase
MKQLLPRVITASLLAATVVALPILGKVWQSMIPMALLLATITWLGNIEYVKLIKRLGIRLERISFIALSVAFIFILVLLQNRFVTLSVFTVAVVWPLAWYAFKREGLKPTLASWFGLAYIAMLLQFTFHLYAQVEGIFYLMFLLLSVWAYDIGAYFAGSFWGREKLLPEVSPGKTWEGVLGGFSGALAVTLSAPLWMPGAEWSLPWMLIALFVSIATQLGDLFESWLKRTAHVKDAGEILPGHGGFLDRIDGLLFASPVVYVYLRYVLDLF